MATPASTERKAPTRRRAPKAEHLSMSHPDLPSVDHPHFWLAAYLAKLAEYVAVEHLERKLAKLDQTSRLGLYSSLNHLRHDMHKSAEYSCKDGLLLYAWPGTKLFTTPQARH